MQGDASAAALLDQLARTIADARLSDDEKRELTQALRDAGVPEDTLRRLRNRAFELVRAQLAGVQADALDAHALLRWLEGVMRAIDVARQPGGTAQPSCAWFSPGPQCGAAITDQLRSARRSIDICVFTLSDDRISAEVLAARRRGVAVRLITDNEKEFDRGSDIAALRDAGVPTAVDRTSAHMHHKFAIFDGARLLNGSYNWTRSAAEHNEENLVLTHDATLVREFAAEFERLWRALAPIA
jgi:mitochondrial cardiolipin hydrolase